MTRARWIHIVLVAILVVVALFLIRLHMASGHAGAVGGLDGQTTCGIGEWLHATGVRGRCPGG